MSSHLTGFILLQETLLQSGKKLTVHEAYLLNHVEPMYGSDGLGKVIASGRRPNTLVHLPVILAYVYSVFRMVSLHFHKDRMTKASDTSSSSGTTLAKKPLCPLHNDFCRMLEGRMLRNPESGLQEPAWRISCHAPSKVRKRLKSVLFYVHLLPRPF